MEYCNICDDKYYHIESHFILSNKHNKNIKIIKKIMSRISEKEYLNVYFKCLLCSPKEKDNFIMHIYRLLNNIIGIFNSMKEDIYKI